MLHFFVQSCCWKLNVSVVGTWDSSINSHPPLMHGLCKLALGRIRHILVWLLRPISRTLFAANLTLRPMFSRFWWIRHLTTFPCFRVLIVLGHFAIICFLQLYLISRFKNSVGPVRRMVGADELPVKVDFDHICILYFYFYLLLIIEYKDCISDIN